MMCPHFQPLAKIITRTSLWHLIFYPQEVFPCGIPHLSQKHCFLTKAFLSSLEAFATFLILEEHEDWVDGRQSFSFLEMGGQ